MVELDENDILFIERSKLQIEQERSRLQTALEYNAVDAQKSGASSSDDHGSDSTEVDEIPDIKDAISSLLVAFQGHRVAKKLRSSESRTTVDRELAAIYSRIDEISTATFLPLVHTVSRKAPDIEIWKHVLHLITSSSRITPPPSVSASFGGTPHTHSFASHQGSEQTKRLLYDALRDELHDCSYVKVPRFFEKYFDNKSWTQKSKDVFDAVKHTHSDGRWTTFPSKPMENAVWEWWSHFQEKHLACTRGIYHTTTSKSEIVDTDGERQLDLFVKAPHASTSDQHDWADVRVIGEHTASPDGGRKFLQLARYARSIFSAQPRRQLVHGFVLYHTNIELHVFDRSGTFSMEPFDIHKEPERFIRVISGYCMMSDEELGLDTFIERQSQQEYVTVLDNDGKDRRLQLLHQPLARRRAIVGRGTSCYRTADGVVKFSWVTASKSPSEPELLRLANERKVEGVPRLIGHRQGTSTGELRSLLVFSKKRRIEGRQHTLNQQRSNQSFSSQFASLPLSDEGRKRKFVDPEQSSSKKSRSNSQTSKLSQVYEADASFNDSQQSQASHTGEEAFVDRVLYIQATEPAGRPLAQFSNVRELLRAIRDAIKVHRSLFLDGKILHRDISESNIIIIHPDKNEDLSGMIIDLELATTVEKGKNTRTGLKRMTGTLKYMAIEVLELGLSGARPDLEHTYRHDLESFFYVFLDMCINHGWAPGRATKKDPLQAWYVLPDYKAIVRSKLGDMGLTGFETLILPEFSPAFEHVKDLAMNLRDLLFLRLPGGKLRTGTPIGDESVLYDQMIGAFNKAIELLSH